MCPKPAQPGPWGHPWFQDDRRVAAFASVFDNYNNQPNKLAALKCPQVSPNDLKYVAPRNLGAIVRTHIVRIYVNVVCWYKGNACFSLFSTNLPMSN